VAVLDAEPALLGAIHQKQPAKRPERLAAKALLAFLVDHDDMPAGVGDLGRGDEAGEPPADYNYIRIVGHRALPGGFTDRSPRPEARSTAIGACLWPRRIGGGVNLFQFGTFRHAGVQRACNT
jgi:hypothetical protein